MRRKKRKNMENVGKVGKECENRKEESVERGREIYKYLISA